MKVHHLGLALVIALPMAGAHHLNSVSKFLQRYHSGQYEVMIRRMVMGPHLIRSNA